MILHKWTLRTCFNAQEEIYAVSMDEVAQLREVLPQLARHAGPPLSPREHRHPYLHGRLPLLRRQSLARLPQHLPPHLSFQFFLGCATVGCASIAASRKI